MTDDLGYDDQTDDGNDDGQDQRYVRLSREQIRTLERDAKQARQAQEKLAALERKLALNEAGVGSLNEMQQKALLATIDGDITAEAARQAAEALGFVQPAPAPEPDPEAAALNRMSEASTGSSDPSTEDPAARLDRVAREGGMEALLAQIQADGHLVVPGA